MNKFHEPVLLTECITGLNINKKGIYVDVTFGGGVGTDLTFKYVAKNVVFVTGSIMVNVADTAIDAVQSTTFTGTGY